MEFERRQLTVGDVRREYLLGVPERPREPATVVFAFHGAGSHADDMREFSQLDVTADERGFVVIFPEGSGHTGQSRSWNAGAPHVYAAKHGIDDIGFFETIWAQVTTEFSVSPEHVFLTGMSNGGLLCYHLANHLADRFAGIAAVACATLDLEIRPPKPMPLMHIHGTDDQFVPYQGGKGGGAAAGIEFVPVRDIVETWAMENGCDALPTRLQRESNQRANDGTHVECIRFEGPAPVILYTVHGGGHTWPGVPSRYDFLGRVTQNLTANKVIWEFFTECEPR